LPGRAVENHKTAGITTVPAEVQTKHLLNSYSTTLVPIKQISQQTAIFINSVYVSLEIIKHHKKKAPWFPEQNLTLVPQMSELKMRKNAIKTKHYPKHFIFTKCQVISKIRESVHH
jgi:hypothetical protein